MMHFYVVPMVGSGTMDDPRRPDLPAETSYVSCDGKDGQYTLATPALLIGLTALTDAKLVDRCKAAGLKIADVQTWRVGESTWP